MKTAISIPDTVFQTAEDLANRLGVSRSELYSKAVAAFVKANKNQGVTDALNKIYSTENSSLETDYRNLQINSIDSEDW